jgi:hypothetical protein
VEASIWTDLEHPITWILATAAGISVLISTVTAIYAMFRYGATSARIKQLEDELGEARAYISDLRLRLANHHDELPPPST